MIRAIRVTLFVVCVALCTGCNTVTSPGPVVQPPPVPVPVLPDVVLQGWDAAKGRAYAKGMDCVVGTEITAVKWEFEDGIFDCGGVLANGCFWREAYQPPTIRLNLKVLSVNLVAHEVSHYLYWECNHPQWRCYLWEDNSFFHPGCE